jgi:hypothetical protein
MVSVHQIAMAHGWELTVTDSRDGGARFEFDCKVRARRTAANGKLSGRCLYQIDRYRGCMQQVPAGSIPGVTEHHSSYIPLS